MIPIEARRLSNPKYHQVMIDNGFTEVGIRHPSTARYICEGSVSVDLPIGTVVQDRFQLYRVIYEHAYACGREQGKSDAIGKIIKSISALVFNSK